MTVPKHCLVFALSVKTDILLTITIFISIFIVITVEVRNPQIQNKQSNEAEQRWRPWTSRGAVFQ